MKTALEWSPFRAWAPRPNKPRWLCWQDAFMLALTTVGCLWVVLRAGALPGYDWNWGLLSEFVIRERNGHYESGLLLRGLFTTLRIGFWSLLFSLLAGGIAGIFFARKPFMVALPFHAIVNLVRSTPPLVILFCVYFFAGNILPMGPIEDFLRGQHTNVRKFVEICFAGPGQLDRMIAAVFALGLYQSAYVAEIVRGAVESVPAGQRDAALALGFSDFAATRLVVLPQAARLMIPSLTGQSIGAFKDSALASLISLPDLTFQSLEIMSTSRMTFEIWIVAGLLYLMIGLICAALGHFLEKRYSIFT